MQPYRSSIFFTPVASAQKSTRPAKPLGSMTRYFLTLFFSLSLSLPISFFSFHLIRIHYRRLLPLIPAEKWSGREQRKHWTILANAPSSPIPFSPRSILLSSSVRSPVFVDRYCCQSKHFGAESMFSRWRNGEKEIGGRIKDGGSKY